MKIKHIVSLLLVLVMIFSLFSCNDEPADADVVTDKSTAEESSEKPNEMVRKSYNIIENLENIKTYGRPTISSAGLSCDLVASGIEFKAYVEGRVVLTLSSSDETYFTLWIDGERSETRFVSYGTTNQVFELGDFKEGGVHTFRFLKQTEPQYSTVDMKSVSFTGYFKEKPVDSSMYIEFIGASMFCGYGNLVMNGASKPGMPPSSDGTQSYAYLTAEKLSADHSVISVSGIGVVASSKKPAFKDVYSVNSYYRSQTDKYVPTRTPDVIISGLGTNDINNKVSLEDWKAGLTELITYIRTIYGKNIPVVWTYNMMVNESIPSSIENRDKYMNAAREAFDALGGEEAGLYLLKVTANREGGGSHPSLEAHKQQSNDVVNFLIQKKLIK